MSFGFEYPYDYCKKRCWRDDNMDSKNLIKKGIILAGGSGTRLYPITQVMTKQLQTVYDKPMIYYPLSTLMLSGISKIMIISTSNDLPKFKNVLGNGSQWGIELQYKIQERPQGIAHAFILAEDFIGSDSVVLILGDNLFYGYYDFLRDSLKNNTGATVFGYYVNDPQRYGVIEFDNKYNVANIREKPENPKSNYAVTGLYVYDNTVVEISKNIKPSDRGELEITDVNLVYLKQKRLRVEIIGRGVAWLDTGNPDSMLEASNFIRTLEKRQGLKFGCPEEVALKSGFINDQQFEELIAKMPECSYAQYLKMIFNNPIKTWELAK